jgi:general secretion pathway protein G
MPWDVVRFGRIVCVAGWLAALVFVVYLALPSDVLDGRSTVDHKEQVLRANLLTLREGLVRFQRDHGRPPESLNQLVAARYIRRIPVDPFTGTPRSWQLVRNPGGGIVQVRSGSNATSSLNSRYSEW